MRDWTQEGWTPVTESEYDIQGIFDAADDCGVEFLDPDDGIVYIADISMEPFTFYGFMTAEFDEDEVGDQDVVNWALENVPAPGAWGAPVHMGQVDHDEMMGIVEDEPGKMYYRILED